MKSIKSDLDIGIYIDWAGGIDAREYISHHIV